MRTFVFKPLYYLRNSMRRHAAIYVALAMVCVVLGVTNYFYTKNMKEINTVQALNQARIVSKELEIASFRQETAQARGYVAPLG